MIILDNLHLALPEMILLTIACLALLVELFFKSRWPALGCIICEFGLIIAGYCSFMFIGNFKTILLGGLYISDDIANLMKLFICVCALLSFFYARAYINARQMPSEYYILGLFSTLGMMVLVSAHSMITIYLGVELLSLPLYAMTALRRTKPETIEAALKYFVMGGLASGMLLYGISLLYGATGKLDLLDIANSVAIQWQDSSMMITFALVFIFAGIGFKLAAIPFHMWAPDVYQGAPTAVTLFLSAGPKIAGVGMALRIITISLPEAAPQWQQILLVMTLLSTGIGNLLAIVQPNIKRMLAYSTIAHMGYALFGLLAADNVGYAAALYYILVYAIMTIAAFGLLVILSSNGVDIERIDELAGLNQRNPWIAFMMLIIMFSMAGIPPTVGFFAKLLVLQSLINVQLTWVAVLGLIFAVVGAYYYVRIVKTMYFTASTEKTKLNFSMPINIVFSINCLALLYLGIFPAGLITACTNAFMS